MADSVNAYTRPTPAQVQELLRQGRGVLLFEAVICIVGGFFAILFPFFASAGIELMLGILCTMLGVLGIIRVIAGGVEHRGATLVTSIVIGVLGVLLLMWPFEGLEAITLVLAVSCLVRGIAELSGFPHRSVMAPGMQMISGVAGIVIAGLLFWWYPDVLWAPGLFFGIQLLFFGMMLVTLWNIAGAPVANPPATNTKG
jgi:uncharacterized membrane protein HdeD (DUF308 family)|tara:strand:- start:200 stop:796 length:597 start_codon:yes stop_codon:yes gene_type:complete